MTVPDEALTVGYYPMWREEMDKTHCREPDCECGGSDLMFVVQRCHPDGGLEVFWHEGRVYIRCNECQRPVMKIEASYRGAS